MNFKGFVKNPVWWQWGISVVALGAAIGFLYQKKSLVSSLATGLILSQVIFISLLSNQGSDHRFVFLFLGLVILFSYQPIKIMIMLGVIWFIWQLFLATNYFSHISFTLRDASSKIGSISQPGDKITGFFSHQLVFENQLYPVYWAPGHDKFRGINEDIDKWKPNFLLQILNVDGLDGKVFTPFLQTDMGIRQEIVAKIKILPMNNDYQVVANLRRIEW